MKSDKARKPRRFRLSRGWQTARNLLLGLLLVVLAWWLVGCPLFFSRLEFRRLERENLMPRSEIVLEIKRGTYRSDSQRNGIPYHRRWHVTAAQFVGMGEDCAVTCSIEPFPSWDIAFKFGRSGIISMRYWPLDEQEGEFKLLPMESELVDWRPGEPWTGHELYRCMGLVVPALPQGTVSAEITVLDKIGEEHREQGSLEGEGVWFFAYRTGYDFGSLVGRPYTLTARDGDGNILAFQKGTVPEAM